MKKNLITMLSFLGTVFLTTGCAATSPAPTTAATATSNTVANQAEEATTVEPAVITMVLPGAASEEAFYVEQLAAFNEAHDDIQAEVIFTANNAADYGQAIDLMFSDGSAPDIFRTSGSYSTAMLQSYAKGRIIALDQYLTDDYKDTFPEGSFNSNGGLMVDGSIYSIPFIAQEFPAFRPMYFNLDVMEEYGYTEIPEDWASFEAMLTDIKEKSNGSVYGYSLAGDDGGAYAFYSWAEATGMSDAVDLHNTEGNFLYNPTTGYSNVANDSLVSAVDFVKNLNDKGLMAPGWETVDSSTLFQYIATNKIVAISGMCFWSKSITDLNPDLNLAAVPHLPEDADNAGNRYGYATCDPYYSISTTCANPDAAWEVIEFISSMEFQEAFYASEYRCTVGYREYSEGVLSETSQQMMDAANEFFRIAPSPADSHEDGNTLVAALRTNTPNPSLGSLFILSIVEGKDFRDYAIDYDEKMDVVIDEQIAILQSEGSDITRDALIFPDDWVPSENYVK